MIGRFPAPVSSPEAFDRARASRRTPRSDALDDGTGLLGRSEIAGWVGEVSVGPRFAAKVLLS